MLKLCQVTKKYFLAKESALDSVDLSFPRGEIVGIFGENGAGKTTLMKSIFGFHTFGGEITLDGTKISRENIHKLSFATCEHSFFSGISAKEHAEFYQGHFPDFRKNRYESLMKFFDLPDNRPIKRLSTGQKNQFEVILALSQGADYIFMDEPFAGNDIFNREDFYKVLLGILEENETVILATHLIEEVEHFISRGILIGKGRVLGDTTMESLEEQGISLTQYVKSTFQYQSDRVSLALDQLQKGEDSHETG